MYVCIIKIDNIYFYYMLCPPTAKQSKANE